MIFVCDVNPVRHIRRPWVTWGLMAASVAATLAVWLGPPGLGVLVLEREHLLHPALLTHALLHLDLLHLVGNLLVLAAFGDNVEDAMGHARFLVFVAASAALSAEAQFLVDPATQALVGASGIGAALISAYLVLHPRAHVAVWLRLAWPPAPAFFPAGLVVGGWIGLNLASALLQPDAPVAWWAHIAGFGAGLVMVLFLRRSDVPLLQPPQPVDELLPRLSPATGWLLRAGTYSRTERTALESLAGRSFWASALLFVVLMLAGELLFG
ncbi:MAG: rhomboid family intramembrane serine protease [Geminicoccaceae bacterium]